MKKIIGILSFFCILLLASCTFSNKKTSGVIDCYSIKLSNSGLSETDYYYSKRKIQVYEYKNENSESIYSNLYSSYGDEVKIILMDVYGNDYVKYSNPTFIGWISYDTNYYLDLDRKIIDKEVRISEYKDKEPDDNADNKKAYQCVKKNYYFFSGTYSSVAYANKAVGEQGTTRHTYIDLGDSCIITYVPKWF